MCQFLLNSSPNFATPKVSRTICHGKRGEIRKAYREGQEDQLSALGLVTNVVVLWNTIYVQAVLKHLKVNGLEVRPEDIARLSSLQHKHINVLGRHSLALAEPISKGELRPLTWKSGMRLLSVGFRSDDHHGPINYFL